MASLNKVILLGNLGRDADQRAFQDGTPVASFSMATAESWVDKRSGEKKEQTEWHNIVAIGPIVDAIGKYLVKGKQVLVEGRLRTRSWEKDGQKHYKTEVKADRVVLLGGGNRADDDDREPARAPADSFDDDIPF